MGMFVYDAIDPVGRAVKGKIEAESEGLVLSKLHDQNFHVLSVIEQKRAGLNLKRRRGAPKLQALVVFSRQFATMIDAGIAIMKCMDILEGQAKDPALKAALTVVRRDVKGGLSLADALAKHTNCFSKLYVNMIRAAELGGILDTILDRLATFLEKEMEIKQKIKSAMMYPIIVLLFSVGMIFALFFFVLPKFKEIFESMNVEMPPMTQALFSMSDLLVRFWYLIPLVGGGAYYGIKRYGMTTVGRLHIDLLKLRAPVVGDLVLKMSVSRFSRTFGTLVASGVPMMRSMEIIGETAGNSVIANAINAARNAIRDGQRISTPLAQSNLFPAMVTHMIDIGEETGRLSEMLVKVSDFYDAEVDAAVKGLTSLIEPMLIVFMGVVVGFIAISVMAPMFKLVSSIG